MKVVYEDKTYQLLRDIHREPKLSDYLADDHTRPAAIADDSKPLLCESKHFQYSLNRRPTVLLHKKKQ